MLPSVDVLTTRRCCVAICMTWTRAAATTAPDASVTVPAMIPVGDCARAGTTVNSSTTTACARTFDMTTTGEGRPSS